MCMCDIICKAVCGDGTGGVGVVAVVVPSYVIRELRLGEQTRACVMRWRDVRLLEFVWIMIMSILDWHVSER